MNTTEIAKFNMIEQQIRPWEVLDHQVLSTLDQLSREDFVPQVYKGLAYADCQIPLINNQRMLPPTVEGRLLLCLGNEHSLDLRELLRDPAVDDEQLRQAIIGAMDLKPEKHHFDLNDEPDIVRFMNTTGG